MSLRGPNVTSKHARRSARAAAELTGIALASVMPTRVATAGENIPDVSSWIERRPYHASSRRVNSPSGRPLQNFDPTSAFAANALKDRGDRWRTSGPAITTICSKVNAFLRSLCSPEPCGSAVFGFHAAPSNIPLWHRSAIKHRALERAVSDDSDGHRDAEDTVSRLGDTAAADLIGWSQTLWAGLAPSTRPRPLLVVAALRVAGGRRPMPSASRNNRP
jgi:hypothetical protein